MNRASIVLLATLGTLFSSAIIAETQDTVYAQVTKVEPQFSAPPAPAPEICNAPKPHTAAGLGAMLRWELAQCLQAPRSVAAYRVYYQWDGRTYSRLTTTPPGESIALRVSIR